MPIPRKPQTYIDLLRPDHVGSWPEVALTVYERFADYFEWPTAQLIKHLGEFTLQTDKSEDLLGAALSTDDGQARIVFPDEKNAQYAYLTDLGERIYANAYPDFELDVQGYKGILAGILHVVAACTDDAGEYN